MKKHLDSKKKLAYMFYMEGRTQKAIAAETGVSEQTLSKWAKDENWAVRRAGVNVTRPELVNKTLAALNRILDQVNESNDIELIASLPDKLSKCASAIEKLDRKNSIVNVMEAFLAFGKWLDARATMDDALTPDLVKEIMRLQNLYVNENINV